VVIGMSDDIKLDVFENSKYILKEDLVDYIKKSTDYEKDSSIRWVIHELVKSGDITKVDSKHYYKGVLKDYSPKVQTEKKKLLKKLISKKYPKLDIVIYETKIFNEWINHQISRNVIFVEVEKYYMQDLFTYLRNHITDKILLSPTTEDFYLYAEDNIIIVSSLVSRAPMNKESYEIKVEKLIVDLFSNDLVSKLFSQSEYATIIDNLFRTYKVNIKTIYSYAKRRNLIDITKKFVKKYDPSEVTK
jgi:polyhydroxyalkanoate synthesis regulator phasin